MFCFDLVLFSTFGKMNLKLVSYLDFLQKRVAMLCFLDHTQQTCYCLLNPIAFGFGGGRVGYNCFCYSATKENVSVDSVSVAAIMSTPGITYLLRLYGSHLVFTLNRLLTR